MLVNWLSSRMPCDDFIGVRFNLLNLQYIHFSKIIRLLLKLQRISIAAYRVDRWAYFEGNEMQFNCLSLFVAVAESNRIAFNFNK